MCVLAFAQNPLEKERFILVQRNDIANLFPVSDNATFSVSADEEFFISDTDAEDAVIDLKGVTGFGIITRVSDSNHDIIDDMSGTGDKPWSISSINGVLIKSSQSGSPDLSGLVRGQVYLLKIGSATYKYVSL